MTEHIQIILVQNPSTVTIPKHHQASRWFTFSITVAIGCNFDLALIHKNTWVNHASSIKDAWKKVTIIFPRDPSKGIYSIILQTIWVCLKLVDHGRYPQFSANAVTFGQLGDHLAQPGGQKWKPEDTKALEHIIYIYIYYYYYYYHYYYYFYCYYFITIITSIIIITSTIIITIFYYYYHGYYYYHCYYYYHYYHY